jgi:GNAT superfamily N-acetyltransferase
MHSSTSTPYVRFLNTDDVKILKELRLYGLQECPSAFSSSYEEESQFSDQTWIDRLTTTNHLEKFVLGAFIGENLYDVLTFIRCSRMKERYKGNFFGMYVMPNCRKLGVGSLLVSEALKTAKQSLELLCIELDMSHLLNEKNIALKLYQKFRFKSYRLVPYHLFVDGEYLTSKHLMLMLNQ